MLPLVTNPLKLVVTVTIANKCEPDTGGLIVAIPVVPVTIVKNVVGLIAAAAVTFTGFGCNPL
jgi:hypothetical protein